MGNGDVSKLVKHSRVGQTNNISTQAVVSVVQGVQESTKSKCVQNQIHVI